MSKGFHEQLAVYPAFVILPGIFFGGNMGYQDKAGSGETSLKMHPPICMHVLYMQAVLRLTQPR